MSAEDRARFAERFQLDDETLVLFDRYAGLLAEWQGQMNLVASSTLDTLWVRHFWDSAQVVDLIPEGARSIIDIGSGAGFPGLVLGILLRKRSDLVVTLIEATQKKCRFLETVVTETGVPVRIIWGRAEATQGLKADVVTARAVGPLAQLADWALPFVRKDTICLFLKGRQWQDELTAAQRHWNLEGRGTLRAESQISETDPDSRILRLTGFAP